MTRPALFNLLFTWLFRLSALGVALMTLRLALAPPLLVMPAIGPYLGAALPEAALVLHLIFGPLALALAPFQLAPGLRAARPGLHRAFGYLYALSILLAALGALGLLATNFQGSAFAGLGFFSLALFWLASTGLGIAAARGRDLARHQRWMRYSIACSFAAVTLRLMMAPLMAAGMSYLQTYDITAWASWLLPVAYVWGTGRRAGAGPAPDRGMALGRRR